MVIIVTVHPPGLNNCNGSHGAWSPMDPRYDSGNLGSHWPASEANQASVCNGWWPWSMCNTVTLLQLQLLLQCNSHVAHGWWWEEPGVTDDEYVMRSIKAEALIFGDIVQGSFVDSYRWWHGKWYICRQDNFHRNLSYKAILGHHWISHNCPEVDLVVKSDDDFFVDIPLLRSHSRLNQNFNYLYRHHHHQTPSPVSWNYQWITMDSFLPVLCGTGAPCLCSEDQRGVGAHFGIFASFECWSFEFIKTISKCLIISGKWQIGEDLLPSSMTVTHEPEGREFFPTYCAGGLIISVIQLIISYITLENDKYQAYHRL